MKKRCLSFVRIYRCCLLPAVLLTVPLPNCTRAVFVGALNPATANHDGGQGQKDAAGGITVKTDTGQSVADMKRTLPTGAVGFLDNIASGGNFSCGLEKQTLWCWGNMKADYSWPQAQDTTNTYPSQVGTASDWLSIVTGGRHACGLKTDHTLWCFGDNYYGQLGEGLSGSGVTQSAPIKVGTEANWSSIGLGNTHTCAIKLDGTLWCFGKNNAGQLGDGTNFDQTAPEKIGTSANWLSVECGYNHTCAIKTDHTLWCWGNNRSGQLGDNSNISRSTPTQVGTDTNWEVVEAGDYFTCALKTDHTLWCWGKNDLGQMGKGNFSYVESDTLPNKVGGDSNWKSLSVGINHVCAIKLDNTLWCWGLNEQGQLNFPASADTQNKNLPTQVGAANDWKMVEAGDSHTCALKIDGTLYCWGQYWTPSPPG